MGEYAGLGFFALLGSARRARRSSWPPRCSGPSSIFAEKQEPFECGEHQLVSPNQRFCVKFYMVAISFIIFDVELVFLFPWAVVFSELGWFGMLAMTPFLAVLAVGLAYEWLKGGLEW